MNSATKLNEKIATKINPIMLLLSVFACSPTDERNQQIEKIVNREYYSFDLF